MDQVGNLMSHDVLHRSSRSLDHSPVDANDPIPSQGPPPAFCLRQPETFGSDAKSGFVMVPKPS